MNLALIFWFGWVIAVATLVVVILKLTNFKLSEWIK